MYSISDKFKNYLKAADRIFDAKVVINDAAELLNDEVIDFEIEESVINEDEFTLGAVVAGKLELGLKTNAVIPHNAKIQPFIRMDGAEGATEWLPLGVYFIDKRVHEAGVWRFTCYDRLILAQKPYITNLLFPITMQTMINEMAIDFFGVEVSDHLIIDPTYIVKAKPEGYTIRDILSFIAISCAAAAVIDKSGRLDFVYFGEQAIRDTILPSHYITCKTVNPLKTYTKIVANYESDIEESYMGEGEIDNTLFFYNPFITEPMLTNIYNAINGFSYMPVAMDWKGRPDLEAGDFIKIQQRDASEITTVMLYNKFVFKGGLKETTESPSLSAQQTEYGFDGTIQQTIRTIEKRIGVYVLTTNGSRIKVVTTAQVKMVLPIAMLSDTSVEFTITMLGQASQDTILTFDIRRDEGTIGIAYKYVLHQGWNTIHCTFLAKDMLQFADNLRLFMKVDKGTFEAEPLQAQFYAYGANLVGDSGIPYAAGEDYLEPVIMLEEVTIDLQTPIEADAEDTLGVDMVDDVTILLEGED